MELGRLCACVKRRRRVLWTRGGMDLYDLCAGMQGGIKLRILEISLEYNSARNVTCVYDIQPTPALYVCAR